ncbi:MAG TPA: YdeI/OmpD-associated family protein [Thermoanaerobaculia bacterium]|nr:YdeI/OmpD-associated family protein [Thermoanaerobaculia bacterium]
MPTLDPRIDVYITKAAPFAQPILRRLRELVHQGCPEVVETIKWSTPAFDFHGPLAHMAAFQAHCVFGFWKGKLVAELASEAEAMGQFGKIRTLADLPPDEVVVAWTRKAAALNASGVKLARPVKHAKPALEVPEDLAAELAKKEHARARATFEGFPPSHRREYLEWLAEAKRPETRAKRLATTLEWLAEGKSRNWRYQK